jgi:chaperonin GroEL (HSP60 family)
MYVGSVKKLVVTDRQNNYALIEEFDCPDTKRIETLTLDAQANLNQSNEESKSRLVVHSDLNNMKKRLGRLRGEIVNITIGAETEIAKNYQQDVIDDVVKACDCATKFGYNIGGNLIIPIAIKNILETNKDLTEGEKNLLQLTYSAFKNVFATVLGNKYNNPRYWIREEDGDIDIDNIISNCIDRKVCYDLVKDDYSVDIINPSYTDIEIINSTFHIISMMNNTNQYITEKIDITSLSKSVE